MKKDDWPKAYAGPRLPTLPYYLFIRICATDYFLQLLFLYVQFIMNVYYEIACKVVERLRGRVPERRINIAFSLSLSLSRGGGEGGGDDGRFYTK